MDPITNVQVDDRGTAAVLSWTTADAVPTRVTYSVGGDAARVVEKAALATQHEAVLLTLTPGVLVSYTIEADAATLSGSFTPGTALTYWLHSRASDSVEYADEFDTAGDPTGTGFNILGTALDTMGSQTGVELLGTGLTFPAQNAPLRLGDEGVATIFVRLSASVPLATLAHGAPGEGRFRVEVRSGEDVVLSGAADVSARELRDVWHRLDVPLTGAGGDVGASGLALRVVAEYGTTGYVVGLEGDHASRVALQALPGLPTLPPAPKTDFTQGARVVVAVIDTGINPYHPVYRRPGAVLPLDELKANGTTVAREIALSQSGTYAARVAADDALWSSIQPYELVWFKDTNVLAVTVDPPPSGHGIRDPFTNQPADGHGTMTSSTVLANFPDAIIVMIQVSSPGLDTISATRWAAAQPWIDVVTTSIGTAANLPFGGGAVPALTRQASMAGKVVINSAGNDPSPLPTDSQDGPPWVIAVTGSQAEGRGKEVLSANMFPDFVATYTVRAAQYNSAEDAYVEVGGTSFSAPAVAGTVAAIIYKVREAKGHEGGIVGHFLAPGVTNGNVRTALNKTAILPPWDGYVAGLHYNGDHTHPPGAPYLTAHWGHVDGRVVDPAVAAILAGDYSIPAEKREAALYKAFTHQTRAAYWR